MYQIKQSYSAKVFYKFNTLTGTCQRIQIDITPTRPPTPRPNCTQSEFFDGAKCQCLPKHIRNDQGVCVINVTCHNNSVYFNGQCVCITGYKNVNGKCLIDCPDYSYSNGVGECICIEGYMKVNGKCEVDLSCP